MSFEHLTKRQMGDENPMSHYRKGISGDWRNYFNEDIENYFQSKTSGIVRELGYEE